MLGDLAAELVPSDIDDETGGTQKRAGAADLGPNFFSTPSRRCDGGSAARPKKRKRAPVSVLASVLNTTPEDADSMMRAATDVRRRRRTADDAPRRRRRLDDTEADADASAPPADDEEELESTRKRSANDLGPDFFRAPTAARHVSNEDGENVDEEGGGGDDADARDARDSQEAISQRIRENLLNQMRADGDRCIAAHRPPQPPEPAHHDGENEHPDGNDDEGAAAAVPPVQVLVVGGGRGGAPDELERRLGARQPEDDQCYLRDILTTTAPEDMQKEDLALLRIARVCNHDYRDKVHAAMAIKAFFDEKIRKRANRDAGREVIKEWTLRSIYNYITQSNSTLSILEDVSEKLRTSFDELWTLRHRRRRAREEEGGEEPNTAEMVREIKSELDIISKLVPVVMKRDALMHAGDGDIGGSLGSIALAHGARRNGRSTASSMGGAASASASSAQGNKRGAGFLITDLQRKRDQTFV